MSAFLRAHAAAVAGLVVGRSWTPELQECRSMLLTMARDSSLLLPAIDDVAWSQRGLHGAEN